MNEISKRPSPFERPVAVKPRGGPCWGLPGWDTAQIQESLARHINLILYVALFLCLSTTAQSGELTIRPGVTYLNSYTDNIDRDPDGLEEYAIVTEIAPSVQVRSEGARASFGLNAAARFTHQTGGEDEGITVRPNLSGTGNIEAIKNRLFLDLNASVSQELLNSQNADTDANQETTAAYRVSPFLVARIKDYGNGELRYTFSHVVIDSSEFSDDLTHTGSLTLDSGDALTRTRATFQVSASHTQRSNDDSITRADVTQTLEYFLTRRFSVFGTGGYQLFDDGDSANEVDGVIWRTGFRLRGPRSELTASYGRIDDEESFAGDLNYRLGAWTTVRAGYSETLETGQERVLDNTQFIGIDPDTGILIDTRTGLPFDPNDNRTSLTNETTRTKSFTAGLTYVRGRNQIGINGTIEEQIAESSNEDEDITSIGVFWERRLDRDTTLLLSGTYEASHFGLEDRSDDEYTGSATISYSILENVTAFASYIYRRQDSTDPTDEYSENRVTTGLHITF